MGRRAGRLWRQPNSVRTASRLGLIVPALVQNTAAITVRVLVLPTAQRVEKPDQAHRPQHEGYRDQICQNIHRQIPRIAFRDTVIDDVDMAKAAISGVANPTTASGTATTL